MSSIQSSPHAAGGGGPSDAGGGGGGSQSATTTPNTTQSPPKRFSPYPTGQIRAGVPPGMVAMANNGQVIMANQVQIANPAALQARLASPYGMVALGGMGGMGMVAAAPQQMMTAMPMIAQNGMGMTMINSGKGKLILYFYENSRLGDLGSENSLLDSFFLLSLKIWTGFF